MQRKLLMHRRHLLTGLSTGLLTASILPRLGGPAYAQGVAAEGSGALGQVPAIQRVRVGDLTVTALSDGYLPLDPSLLVGTTPDEALGLIGAAFLDPAAYQIDINAYVVETGQEAWLVDAGAGAGVGPTAGRLQANLRAAGYEPSQIAAVLLTHLHPDHFGGLLNGDGTPAFPQAELHVAEAERAFWTDAGIRAQAPAAMQGFSDVAQGVLDAYGEQVVTFGAEALVRAGATAVPLPGHTPGHAGFLLDGGADQLLVWGDVVHVPPVQFARPEVTVTFDADPAQAAATRATILDRVAADRIMVAGAHMAFPGIAYVEPATEGFRAVPVSWQHF
jgi:glyoxylase-like metal-dependent hydrolase (beta-lactamase superfamily II)